MAFLAVGLAVILIFDQSFYWRKIEDYSFGFFVPLFAAYVIYDRWPKIRGYLLGLPAGSGTTGAEQNATAADAVPARQIATQGGAMRFIEGLFNVVAPLVAFACLLGFALGGFIRAGQGPAYLSSLALCFGLAGYLLSTAYMISDKDVEGRAYTLAQRLGFVFLFTFPALVWLISGPMVEFFATELSLYLQGIVANVVYHVFNILGMPLTIEGSVLIMAKGQVGVADACTGIRSLTGCIFAGCFLAAVFLDRFWKKFLLVALAMVLAFITNLFRGLFLTAWAYHYGSDAIEGTVHDITGYAVLGLTTVFLLLLLPLFQLRLLPEDDDDDFHGDGGDVPGDDNRGGKGSDGGDKLPGIAPVAQHGG